MSVSFPTAFHRRLAGVGSLFTLLLVGACAPRTIPPETPKPSVAKILADISRPPRVHTLQAWGKSRLWEGDEKWTADMAMILKRPNKIRIQGFSPFGSSLYSLTVSKGQVTFFVPSEGRVYRGAASPAIMARFFSLPFEPDDVLDVLTGRVPLCGSQARGIYDEGAHWVLEVPCEQQVLIQRIRIHPGDLQKQGFSFYEPHEAEVLKVEWKKFRAHNDIQIPTEITTRVPEKQQRLQLLLKEIELNVELSDERFATQPPPDTEVLPLSF